VEDSEILGGKLPTLLDGVSVTSTETAAVNYISPSNSTCRCRMTPLRTCHGGGDHSARNGHVHHHHADFSPVCSCTPRERQYVAGSTRTIPSWATRLVSGSIEPAKPVR